MSDRKSDDQKEALPTNEPRSIKSSRKKNPLNQLREMEADVESKTRSANLINQNNDSSAITIVDQGGINCPELEHGVNNYMEPQAQLSGNGDDDDELAVAIPVNAKNYPSAIEYDPNAKPPLLSNRRFRLYACVGTFLFLGVIALVVALILLLREEPLSPTASTLQAPAFSPTKVFENIPEDDSRNIDKLVEQLSNAVGDAASQVGTMEHLAARWIIYKDPMQLHWYEPALIQRYLLVLFYFQTTNSGENTWRSCNPPSGLEENSTCQHLRFTRLINGTIVYVPEDAVRWLSEAHECDWIGCFCDDNYIIRALSLVGQNVTGFLPTDLAQLPLLQSIRIAYNAFSGTLPTDFASMRQLLNLELHGNQLTGTFPEEYFEAKSLQNLNIGDNHFTGTLSSEFAKLTNLKGFHTFGNFFTGTIPPELFDMRYISFTRHDRNILSGTIPSSIGKLSQLQEIWLSANSLTGTIPSEVGLMTNLISFHANLNKLTGSIPSELYNAQYLVNLGLYTNWLTGTLDDRIGDLSDLRSLFLSRNRLEGNITTALENLEFLEVAWLHKNNFTGDVPPGLCKKNMEVLEADCFPRGNAPNPCECCSSCCHRVSEICQIVDDDLAIEFN